MARIYIEHERAYILYNAEKKEMMGIFSRQIFASRYLFEKQNKHVDAVRVGTAAVRRGGILKSKFPFKVAVRFASAEQEALLEGQDYKILNGYPEPLRVTMKGFDSTRESMSAEYLEKVNRYWTEYDRIKKAG